MIPAPRTVLITLGQAPRVAANACSHRYVDSRFLTRVDELPHALSEHWCHLYDNLALLYAPSPGVQAPLVDAALIDACRQVRHRLHRHTPLRIRQLPCPLPGAGFALAHAACLNQLNRPTPGFDAAIARCQEAIDCVDVRTFLLHPTLADVSTAPLWWRWLLRLHSGPVAQTDCGRWQRAPTRSGVDYCLRMASTLAREAPHEGRRDWVMSLPETEANASTLAGIRAWLAAQPDHPRLKRCQETRKGRYTLAWMTKARALP
ncbi:MAG: hypothetical protein ACX931_16305 [Saccharospirillum sp.]